MTEMQTQTTNQTGTQIGAVMRAKDKCVLVLGATGGIGRAFARAMQARGWQIIAMNRTPDKGRAMEPSWHWVKGDAMRAADVLAAAEGASVIFHGVNPAGYVDWDKYALPMLDNTIAAATTHGATIVFPGNVYNFGPDAWSNLTEEAPQNPETEKGRIRVAMESRLREATRNSDKVQVIIVRAGDFIGPDVQGSWLTAGMVTRNRPLSRIVNPVRGKAAHQWAYVPDLAETMAQLVEKRGSLGGFAPFHFEGFVDADGTQLVQALERVAGRKLSVMPFPWFALPLIGLFVPFMREVYKMRYLWRERVIMKNDRLVSVLGKEPRTPIDEALRVTLASIGSLPIGR